MGRQFKTSLTADQVERILDVVEIGGYVPKSRVEGFRSDLYSIIEPVFTYYEVTCSRCRETYAEMTLRDEDADREYLISGECQICQDMRNR